MTHTSTEQPQALRLADQLRDMSSQYKSPSHEKGVINGTIQELRRLHARNVELKAQLAAEQQGVQAEVPEVVAWRWRKPVVNDQGETVGATAWELSDAPDFLTWWTNEPLIRLSDCQRLQADHERLQAALVAQANKKGEKK